jgi:uncharacterized RDD family membrane protein YckC
MSKPLWWERVLAAVIDGLVLMIPNIIVWVIFGLLMGRSLALNLLIMLFAMLIITAGVVAYKVFMESGPKQATIGKIVLGLQVVDASSGGRVPVQQALIRTWPWWMVLANFLNPVPVLGVLISLAILGVWIALIVVFAMDPNGQSIHDKMARCMVAKTSKGMIGQ